MQKWGKAFTLIELLIVVVILGILAAIVIPQFTQEGSPTSKLAQEYWLVDGFRAEEAKLLVLPEGTERDARLNEVRQNLRDHLATVAGLEVQATPLEIQEARALAREMAEDAKKSGKGPY